MIVVTDEQHTVTRCNTEQGNETDDSRNTDFSCCNHQSKYTTDQCQRKIQQDNPGFFHTAELIVQQQEDNHDTDKWSQR